MKLSASDVAARAAEHPGWTVSRLGAGDPAGMEVHESIVRTYALASFADAIAFVTRLAFDAEAADHHPDLQINYRKVTVTWSTHDAGGLTDKDFAGARQSDMIATRFSKS